MRKALKYLAFLALAVVLLHFSFKGVKWSDFIYGLRTCNWWWIIASMAIGILGFLARALRWRLLLRAINKEVTTKQLDIDKVVLIHLGVCNGKDWVAVRAYGTQSATFINALGMQIIPENIQNNIFGDINEIEKNFGVVIYEKKN